MFEVMTLYILIQLSQLFVILNILTVEQKETYEGNEVIKWVEIKSHPLFSSVLITP